MSSAPCAGPAFAALLLTLGCSGSAPSGPAAPAAGPATEPAPTRTACDSLPDDQRRQAQGLLEATYIHDCCDQPLARCLEQEPRCRLAVRLAENVCRRVARGEDDQQIERALSHRASLARAEQLGDRAEIDLRGAPAAGAADAPVTVVLFAGPRGTHCARVTPLIHEAVSSGPLAGKAKLYLVPFPLRSNPHSKEAGVAFLAAQDMGRLWEFALHAYARFDDFEVSKQAEWAAAVGLDRERFEQLTGDPALAERLAASKMQGLELGVESTPTFFVDGLRYPGELEIDELVDTIEEIYERSQGETHEP